MTTLARNRYAALLRAAAPVAFIVIGAAILQRFPPDQYSFYPQCPMHSLFGVLCPGCGTTRALAALLHGNLTEAIRLNALTTLLVPLAAVYAIVLYVRVFTNKPFRLLQPPPVATYATLAITILFTITRNL